MDHFKSFGVEIGQGRYHEEAIYGIALVYTVLFNDISAYLNKYDLTPAKMNVLMIIKHQGKGQGLMQAEIGKRLMVTPSNMTRLLEKLERDGLTGHVALAGDKRVKIVNITAKGSKLLDNVWLGYEQCIKDLAGQLPKGTQKEMARLLQQWLSGLRRGRQ